MASLITNPIAGAYTGAYNALSLGIMSDEGFILGFQPMADEVNETDQFGATLIEMIYRGGNWKIRFRTKEWNAGMQGAFQVWGAHNNSNNPPAFALGIIGRLGSAVSKALVLTSTAGTPAATSPSTLTAAQAILSPNNNLDINFTSRIREVPIEMVCLPYANNGNNVPWTTT